MAWFPACACALRVLSWIHARVRGAAGRGCHPPAWPGSAPFARSSYVNRALFGISTSAVACGSLQRLPRHTHVSHDRVRRACTASKEAIGPHLASVEPPSPCVHHRNRPKSRCAGREKGRIFNSGASGGCPKRHTFGVPFRLLRLLKKVAPCHAPYTKRNMTCPDANGACKWGPSPCARPSWRRPPGPCIVALLKRPGEPDSGPDSVVPANLKVANQNLRWDWQCP